MAQMQNDIDPEYASILIGYLLCRTRASYTLRIIRMPVVDSRSGSGERIASGCEMWETE
jgi:hypothetical protein